MSSTETIRRYLAERYAGVRFVALALVLAAVGAWTTSAWRDVAIAGVIRAFAAAWLLVLAFRAWDDLEDRDADAVRHPERVAVTGDARALWLLALSAAIGAVALVVAGVQREARLAMLAGIVVVLLAWYRLRSGESRSAVADAHVLLLKYPLIAAIVAPGAYEQREVARAVPVLTVLYLLLCTYEWADDPRLRRRLSSTIRGPLP